MIRLRRFLLLLVVLELLASAGMVGWRCTRPIPPNPDLARLPPSTIRDFKRLQQAARDDHLAGWRELGEAYLAYGYFVEAEACFRRAVTVSPHDFPSHYGWAYSFDRLGRTRDANREFKAAAKLADKDMARTCWYHIGRNLLREEDAAAAERAFSHANKFPAADHQRAKLLIAQHRDQEAWSLINRLEALDSDDLEVQFLAMRGEQSRDRHEAAGARADRLERCTNHLRLTDHWEYLQPIRSRYGLAADLVRIGSLATSGQTELAANLFESLVAENDPEIVNQFLLKGLPIELQAGRAEKARQLIQDLIDRSAPHPMALHLLGDAYQILNQPRQASETWELANRLSPRAESHEHLADWFEQVGDPDRARQERGLACLTFGMDAFRKNDLALAQEFLEKSVELISGEPRTWFYLGETRRALLLDESATDAYQRCLALNPDHGRARHRLEFKTTESTETR